MSISGGLVIPYSCAIQPFLEDRLHDRQTSSRFPLAGLPAGLADRALISHRGVGAFAPASLSDAVYSFNPAKLSNKIRNVFCFFYKLLKTRGINVVHRRVF